MDLSYLENLIKLFESSTLTELEIDEEGSRVTLGRTKEQPMFAMPPQMQYAMPPPTGGVQAAAAPAEAAPASSAKTHEVKSPIVGTLYRAPAPDADPYVQMGQHVENGTTLCIIEAMKLMNEIESDAAGKIVKILVENGQPVEYGQPLFLLEIA
ncbi:MAG TPA: acetyl-CoA carboxylase biotin carboxyl carrier protein [Candidatus Kapabacteria bacterium]|jgi:acetyl-CoA carboxylase biotin carboxyl carrier protein